MQVGIVVLVAQLPEAPLLARHLELASTSHALAIALQLLWVTTLVEALGHEAWRALLVARRRKQYARY